MFTDIKDFYPTPRNLINKMISGVNLNTIKTILEPSAGKGSILEVLEWEKKYHKHLNIDCIEISPELQLILKGKNHCLVHDDFLTYDGMKQYDLIIMNPPFSEGDKHLLRALQMQEEGGYVSCILNAETLKNPYSNTRKDLARKLKEYNADIEYIENGFIDAERKTGVEIAIIKVHIEAKEGHSFILDGLRKAQEQREYVEREQNQIVENDLLKAITDQYKLEVNAGVNLIKEYNAMSPLILSEFTKDGQKGKPILKLDLSNNRDSYSSKLSINGYIEEVRHKYWKALFSSEKFVGKLTDNLRHDLYKRIDELKQYDFTLYNIYQLQIEMSKSIIKGVEETILNLFDEFSHKHYWDKNTSSNIHYYNGWATNKSWKINKKVIIPLDAYHWGRYEPSSYTVVDKLSDIEKCFNYLDGGITEALDIREQLKFAEGYGETSKIQLKYYMVTFYKKGTAHLEFTNLELLKKFNLFAGKMKMWLPPSYGKTEYNNMTQEEKAVVDEFEGEKSYKETLANKNYYIFNSSTSSILMLEDNTRTA